MQKRIDSLGIHPFYLILQIITIRKYSFQSYSPTPHYLLQEYDHNTHIL